MRMLQCLALLSLSASLSTAEPVRLPDTVVNGGFEEGLLGFDAHVAATVVAKGPHAGDRCLRIDGATDRNSFVQQSVTVEPGREYELSVWVRSAGVPEGADCKAYFNAYGSKELLLSATPFPRIAGDTEWTRHATRVRLPEGTDKVLLLLQLYQSAGTVWFDDLSFVPVVTDEEQARWSTQAAAQERDVAAAVALSKSAPEVAPGVRFAETPEGLFLCNERLALLFGGPDKAFGLRNLVDLVSGRAFIVPGYETDLFRIEMRPSADYAYAGTVALSSGTNPENCTHRIEAQGDEAVLHLKWQGVRAEGNIAVDAEATVSLRAGDMARWRLSVSRRVGSALWLVDFPRFPAVGASGEGAAQRDYLAIPMQQGWRWPAPRRTIDWGEGWADYPGGGKSMQFEAYWVGGEAPGGLYFATEDPACNRKTALCKARGDAFSYGLRNYPPDMGRTGEYVMPYAAVTGVFSGDWWDAARIYRRWALQQPWSAAGPVKDRKTTPEWLKNVGAWAQGDLPGETYADMAGQAERVIKFQDTVGGPLAFHAYIWQNIGTHDSGYPFLLPPKPGAREFVEHLQAAGVRVVPYLNIYSGDGKGPRFGPEGLQSIAMHTASGHLYADPTGLVPMCVATSRWQSIMDKEFRGTLDAMPVDGLYLDQLTGAAYLCLDGTHGHPVGGGDHFYQGLRKLCQEAKAAAGPERMTFGENTSEGFNDVIDAQLPWAEMYLDRNLPLFQTVYADYMIRFGVFIGRPDTWGDAAGYYSKLGYSFVIGQQPGWIMFGILSELDNPEYAPLRASLRDLATCRLAALDFLQYGEYLRPLDLKQQRLQVAWDDWSTPRPGALEPVLNGVWRATDGRIGVSLANWTAEEREVHVPVQAEWGLRGTLRWRVCQAGQWSEQAEASPSGVTVRLPAHTVMVVELRGE